MRVLVTGAAGFIGSRLSEALLTHGHEVVGIDDLSTGREDNFPDARLVIDDIRTQGSLPVGPWDLIYHCAASYKDRADWERDASTNVLGTINVVREAQRWDARLVYFQTSLCYGPTPRSPIQVDARLEPQGSYAVSKTAGESYIRDSGLKWVSLRLANMYGPRNLSGPIPTFFQRLTEGKPCTVVDSRRDFVFVDDLVWVAVKAGLSGQGVYHVSSGSDVSIYDLWQAVANEVGGVNEYPTLVTRGPDDVATLLLDPHDTYEEFGWIATTPLSEGIKRAVQWYREHPVTETYSHLRMAG